ncbi:MAG: hypothetical protein CME71_00825 [Halobacteriovorax sp.]|nr:hypothetical protein [Halobacteriovorax sp.]
MQFFKFSLLILMSLPSFAMANSYTESQCLDASYETSISHKGFPFGLTQNILGVSKEKCVITISHEKLKFIKDAWVVDVCREPVHMKKGAGAVEVIKREGLCVEGTKSSYCGELDRLKSMIQDDGLIFAQGEKEDLSSDHGKVYCAFSLLQRYLGQGIVLSRHSGSIMPQPSSSPMPETNTAPVATPIPSVEGSTGSF